MPAKITFSSEQLMDMGAQYAAGASYADLALAYGCAKNTVRAALQRAGLQSDRSRSIRKKAIGRPSPRKGATWTAETRRRWTEARAGMPWAGRTGPHTLETRAKISAATRGKNVTLCAEERQQIESIRQVCKRFVRRVLKASGSRKELPTEASLGYSSRQLWTHLGPRPHDGQVDHYVPIAEFFRRGIRCPRIINALPNLRWLPGDQNRRKSDRVPPEADQVIERCIAFASGGVTYTPGIEERRAA